MKPHTTAAGTVARNGDISRQAPDYGLDAPGAVGAMFVIGLVGVMVGVFLVRWTLSGHPGPTVGLAYATQIFGVFCLIVASLMFASSRVGKFHARDHLLARLEL